MKRLLKYVLYSEKAMDGLIKVSLANLHNNVRHKNRKNETHRVMDHNFILSHIFLDSNPMHSRSRSRKWNLGETDIKRCLANITFISKLRVIFLTNNYVFDGKCIASQRERKHFKTGLHTYTGCPVQIPNNWY